MNSTILIFFIICLGGRLTFAQESTPTSFWLKVSDSTAFSPRDSSPNACIVHDGAIWIFGGYRNENDTIWHTKSDVWRSEDGIEWDSINANPPYSAYSAFVSFEGFIWAFGNTSFRSSDGLTWDTVNTNIAIALGSRATIFNDAIWITDGTSVRRTEDGYNWDTIVENAPWEFRSWPGFLAYNNKLWFFGGGNDYLTGNDIYYNDVWSSNDGVDWELETQNATWPGRYWFGYQVYDNKMWILGGWNYYERDNAFGGNLNDTWYTENGIDWFQLPSADLWSQRHGEFVWVFADALWISSGYGNRGKNTLYNDIWKLTNFWKNGRVEQTLNIPDTIIYGTPLPLHPEPSSGLEMQVNIDQAVQTEVLNLQQAPPGNYIIRYVQAGNSIFRPYDEIMTIVVAKKDLVISVRDYSRPFGSRNPDFSLEFDGFVYDDGEEAFEAKPHAVTSADLYSPEGVYDIVIEGGSSSKYNLIYRYGSLYIESPELDFLYYPNPVVSQLTVHVSQNETTTIQLFDPMARLIADVVTDASSFILDMSKMASGVYLLRITTRHQARSVRIRKL